MSLQRKIFNPLYLLSLVLVALLFYYNARQNQTVDLFFGFTENKETEINLDYAVRVENIEVKPGDFIAKGTKLATLTQLNLLKEISDEQLKVNELNSEYNKVRKGIEGEIEILRAEQEMKLADVDFKIQEVEEEIKYQEQLKNDLTNVSNIDNSMVQQLNLQRIERYQKSKQDVRADYAVRIQQKQERIKNELEIHYAAVKRHKSDVGFNQEKLKKLDLISPSDALVGNVNIKRGEYVESFKTMMTLYEPNPTSVVGFVHERMIVNVNVGDEFKIVSLRDQSLHCKGIVSGLGSRIVEIPERMRKMPELKTYGREVIIAIPADNDFLQKEKVILYFGDNISEGEISTAQQSSK